MVGSRKADQLRLGVSVPPAGLPFSEIPAWCGRSEELGYTDVWTYEGVLLDGFTPAALAAAGTRSARIGIGIVPAFTRPAGLIALSPGYQPVLRRQGFGEEIDGILAKWAAGDRAAAPGQVSDAMLAELVLMGDPDAIASRLADYAAAGLGTAALQMAPDLLEPLAPPH